MPAAYDKTLLLVVAVREARGDGREGIRAVAHSVANRVKAWNQSWVRVITTPLQYSSMTLLGDSQTVFWPNDQDATNICALIDMVYAGTDPDNTGGALFYANEANVTSDWYREHIMENPDHPITAVVGKQTFRK